MKRTLLTAIVAVALFAASPAFCSTYFVATTGNDTTGNGSIGSPYATIGKAVGVVVAGDTIYVRAGTYSYTGSSTAITLPAKTGSSETNRCSLMGYNGERPLVDFSAMTGTAADGLKINGSYWYIYGIDFKGAPHNGIKISGGNYNIIEFCTSYQNRNTGVQLGAAASYNQIINCDSYRNYDGHNSGADADGFSPKMDVGTGNYFYGCRSWQNSDDAYDGYLRPSDDVTTTYENCWAFECGWYWLDGSTNTGMNGNGFKMGGSDNKDLRHNAILKNCLSFSNKAKGFDQNSNLGSMTLYNCTAFNNGGNNFLISLALASGKTATVTNSIYLTGPSSLASFVVQATNGWMSPFVVTAADFASIDPAAAYGPRQPDGSLPDIAFMRLVAGSDLIDGGTDVGLPYSGSKPDLGAFEYVAGSDTTAPAPDPMTFATSPYAASATAVAMVATTALDISGVEYYFACTAGGGHDSAWQNGAGYTDTGLTAGVTYSYRVIARDKSANQNETAWSAAASATPQADSTAPTPNPMTWQTVPYAINTTSVGMAASTATDASGGVQYYFANLSAGGHDSGWQSVTTYTDSGLTPGATYIYTVKARDISLAANETAPSAQKSVTTPSVPPLNPPSAYWMFNETSGTVAYDSVGSNNGTLQGTTLPVWAAGMYNNCLTFAAGGGKVYVPNNASIDFADEDLTVSLWAKQPTSFTGQYELFIKGTIGGGAFPGGGKRYELYRKDATFRFAIDDNVTKSEISVASTDFCTGNWVHIVAVRDTVANQIRLYANGVLKSTVTDNTGSISQTDPLYIADGVLPSPGAIDDVRIYRYAMTQAQITAVYGGAGLPDNTAPTPNPMTWAVEPNATGIDTITMTATTAVDISGVEYFFANITDPNHDSGWQDSTTYIDSGLVNNAGYTYAVIARDKSINHNETGWSGEVSATTFRYDCTSPIASDLNDNCQVDFLDFAALAGTWIGDIDTWSGLAQFATDWLTCNRNPAGECWQ